MTSKRPKDKKIWTVNGFPIHLELYDSEIIVKDENDNIMRITKQGPQSIVLNVNGIFTSGKKTNHSE